MFEFLKKLVNSDKKSTGKMTYSSGFDQLINRAAFYGHESQLHLSDLYGTQRWDVDLAAGTFTFGGLGGTTYPVQLLGSTAPGPKSWLWGWANSSDFDPRVHRVTQMSREVGERLQIPELTTGELPFPDGDDLGMSLAWRLSLAVSVISNVWFSYTGSIGGGSRVWVLLEGLELPAPSALHTVNVITEVIGAMALSDPQQALASYAELRGIGWDGTRLTLPDGDVVNEFDPQGRIKSLSSEIRS